MSKTVKELQMADAMLYFLFNKPIAIIEEGRCHQPIFAILKKIDSEFVYVDQDSKEIQLPWNKIRHIYDDCFDKVVF